MARKVEKRDADGYTSEIHRLSRLRTALAVDRQISPDDFRLLVGNIDALIEGLRSLIRAYQRPDLPLRRAGGESR